MESIQQSNKHTTQKQADDQLVIDKTAGHSTLQLDGTGYDTRDHRDKLNKKASHVVEADSMLTTFDKCNECSTENFADVSKQVDLILVTAPNVTIG